MASKKNMRAEDIFPPHILAKYDPEAAEYVVNMVRAGRPAAHEHPMEEVRANPGKFAPPWSKDPTGWEGVEGHVVNSKDGYEVKVMVYTPDEKRWGRGPFGCHLNFHGGGFVLGDLTTESSLCASMRDGAGVVVVDVNYRHCPEATWGKGIEDAFASLLWVRSSAEKLNIRPDSISIGGISAGGHTSLVLQHLARDNGINLRLCMASVPSADKVFTFNYHSESEFLSFHEFYNGPVLSWSRIEWFAHHCLPRDKMEERLSLVPEWWWAPLRAPDFRGLCDTFIKTGETDPLRDEGEAYAFKSFKAGNKVTVKRYIGCPHTFMFWDGLKKKKEYDEDSVSALRLAHCTL